MKVDLIPIGNSQGIRIPKVLIEQCGFGKSIEIELEENCLVFTAASRPRNE